MRSVLVISLLVIGGVARARPGELTPPSTSHRDSDELIHVDKAGTGDPPEDSDEATYTYDVFFKRDPDQVTHEAKTRRLTEANDRIRDNLLQMRPGEVRRIWFSAQDDNNCSHFGCERKPDPYAARLELVSVTSHHAALPEGMHITAWPHLGVRRGDLWVSLSPERIQQIDETRLVGDHVTIDYVAGSRAEHASLTMSLDELRARVEDAAAQSALAQRQWDKAVKACDRAVALDPAMDQPYVDRAIAELALHKPRLAAASIGPVAARNPVWLYWIVMATKGLAGMRTDSVIVQLAANVPGTFDVSARACTTPMAGVAPPPCWIGVAEEPTGRFLIAFAGGLKVIDRKTGAVVAYLDFSADEVNTHSGAFLAAQQTIRALGFVATTGELANISYGDPQQGIPQHPFVVFPVANYELARAVDRSSVKSPLRFVEIAPPAGMKVTAAVHIGALFIYRWNTGGMGDVSIVSAP